MSLILINLKFISKLYKYELIVSLIKYLISFGMEDLLLKLIYSGLSCKIYIVKYQ